MISSLSSAALYLIHLDGSAVDHGKTTETILFQYSLQEIQS